MRWRQFDAARGQRFDSNTDWANWGSKIEERLHLWPGGEVVLGYDYLQYGGKFEEVRPTSTSRLEDTYFTIRPPILPSARLLEKNSNSFPQRASVTI